MFFHKQEKHAWKEGIEKAHEFFDTIRVWVRFEKILGEETLHVCLSSRGSTYLSIYIAKDLHFQMSSVEPIRIQEPLFEDKVHHSNPHVLIFTSKNIYKVSYKTSYNLGKCL